MYYYFFHRTPSMPLKRVIMILAASLEFEKKYNSEIVERESDNEEVPHVSACSVFWTSDSVREVTGWNP